MEKQKILNELKENYLDQIHLIEPYQRDILKCVVANEDYLLFQVEDIDLVYVKNENGIDSFLQYFNQKNHILCVSGCQSEKFDTFRNWNEIGFDYNYAYLKKDKIAITIPDEISIRILTLDDLEYVYQHYETVQDYEYLTSCINRGMLGVCVNHELHGFIGMHTEGTMGILYIEEDYRKQHLASILEASFINHLLDCNIIPFGQVNITNIASQRLQEKLGLIRSNHPVKWYF